MPETLEDRLARKAQAGMTPAPTPATPMAGAPLSLEDRLRQKSLAGGAAPPIPPPPGGQTDTQPGFWESAWKQVNPVPMIQSLRELGQQSGQEQEELAKQYPGYWERQPHEIAREARTVAKVAGGMVKGLFYDLPREVASEVSKGQYRTAAGTTAGVVAPFLLGAGLKKILPATAQLPKAAAGLQKAEQAYTDVRAGLPTIAPEALQSETAAAGQRALTGAYKTRQGLQESARQAARAKYSDYEKALTHPNNVAPPGLQLKEGVFEPDAQGNLVMKKPPVLTTTPFNSPVETAPFRTELEQLIEHDVRSPFPAGSPIRKFLDAMGPAKGYDYVQFDDLKKALGKLSVYADPKGGLRDPYQGMARQIIDKAHPILMDKLKDIARESECSYQESQWPPCQRGTRNGLSIVQHSRSYPLS